MRFNSAPGHPTLRSVRQAAFFDRKHMYEEIAKPDAVAGNPRHPHTALSGLAVSSA